MQYEKVHGYIESGKAEGAKVVVGGTKRTGKGYFLDPTSIYSVSFSRLCAHAFNSFHRHQTEYEDRKPILSLPSRHNHLTNATHR